MYADKVVVFANENIIKDWTIGLGGGLCCRSALDVRRILGGLR